MKKEIAKIWVDALRSGKYQQGREALRDNDKFCCLGILCELAVNMGVIKRSRNGIYDKQAIALPRSVTEWSGMQSSTGFVKKPYRTSLSGLNDRGKPFTEIADIIEQNVEKL